VGFDDWLRILFFIKGTIEERKVRALFDQQCLGADKPPHLDQKWEKNHRSIAEGDRSSSYDK
jgi:hypothetical protein